MKEFEEGRMDRPKSPEIPLDCSILVARCYGCTHQSIYIDGSSDEAMQSILPNLYSNNDWNEEFYMNLKLESRPKEGKPCSGDFVGAAVIHQEAKDNKPKTTIVLLEVDALSDSGIGWNNEINPDGVASQKIAEVFGDSSFLMTAHNLAQGIDFSRMKEVDVEQLRDTLVSLLSRELAKSGCDRESVPSQRLRAIYSICLIVPAYDGKGTTNWAMLASKADIEGYVGSGYKEKGGDLVFGYMSRSRHIVGDSTVDELDAFAKHYSISPDAAYEYKIGRIYDVIGPFPDLEKGKLIFYHGKTERTMGILLRSDGVARNDPIQAEGMVKGRVYLNSPNPILSNTQQDDSSYIFLEVGVY